MATFRHARTLIALLAVASATCSEGDLTSKSANCLIQVNTQFQRSIRLKEQSSHLSVAIVEEHHEVLPYWFADDISSQAMPPLLLHFDAHPDLAVPQVPEHEAHWNIGVPAKSAEQAARRWMRSNDEFIIGAALEGRLRHMVWVYPEWDLKGPRHKHGTKLTVYKYGTTSDKDMCECRWVTLPRVSQLGGSTAWSAHLLSQLEVRLLNQTGKCMNYDEDDLQETECHLSDKSLTVLEIAENELLAPHQLFSSFVSHIKGDSLERVPFAPLSLLLDIDEDYFAQDSTRWHGKLLGQNWLHNFNHLLKKSLCPKQAVRSGAVVADRVEPIANAALRVAVAMAHKHLESKDSTEHDAIGEVMFDEDENLGFQKAMTDTGIGAFLCDHSPAPPAVSNKVEHFGSQLLGHLLGLKESHGHHNTYLALRILEEEGVCLSTSIATEGALPHLHACFSGKSNDVAEDTDFGAEEAVLAHSPFEIRRRMQNFAVLLQKAFGPPLAEGVQNFELDHAPLAYVDVRQVSICRSVRDGYTPRGSWHEIEGPLLTELNDWIVQRLHRHPNVTFDMNLLGGQQGWDAHASFMKPTVM